MGPAHVIERSDFDHLFDALARRGYAVIGPTVRAQAIVYDEIRSSAELPAGWTDEQDGGTYRLRRRADGALFGYAVGAHSWKRYQLPLERRLWHARLDARGAPTDVREPERDPTRLALLAVRSCELHAMDILHRVLGSADDLREPFVIAVQCG